MSYKVTDSSAKNIYYSMSAWYNADVVPGILETDKTFFGFKNFNLDKLYYCIQYLRENYSVGWFTENYTERTAAITRLANALYVIFDGEVEIAAIKKFIVFVYNFAKQDADAVAYFTNGESYGIVSALAKEVKNSVGENVSTIAENIAYGVKYPSLSSLAPDWGTIAKWGLLIGGSLFVINHFSKKF